MWRCQDHPGSAGPLAEWDHARKESAVTHPPIPRQSQPANDPDLPEVFRSLIGIDVIDGELVPRASEPPQR
jgi:hypothetical protein